MLRVSLPLVISMTTTVVMTFTDRVFLANYSIDAIAAALPAGDPRIEVYRKLAALHGSMGFEAMDTTELEAIVEREPDRPQPLVVTLHRTRVELDVVNGDRPEPRAVELPDHGDHPVDGSG